MIDRSGSQADEASSDSLFADNKPSAALKHVKKSVRVTKSRKSEPVTVVRDDEYYEDEGRMESQQFLALVELESKKKHKVAKAANAFIEKFSEGIKDNERALKTHLQELIAASYVLLLQFQRIVH